jgi:hypothetical protein
METEYKPKDIYKSPRTIGEDEYIHNVATPVETKRQTTYELLESYFDAHLDMQMESDEQEKITLENKVEEISTAIMKKIENIEHVMVKKDLITEQLKCQIDIYNDVLSKLRKKLLATNKGWKSLEGLIITAVDNIGERDGTKTTVENNGFKYTSYESPGALEILDKDSVPQEYTRIKTEIDKARLRKDILEGGDKDYAKIPKIKRLKIS